MAATLKQNHNSIKQTNKSHFWHRIHVNTETIINQFTIHVSLIPETKTDHAFIQWLFDEMMVEWNFVAESSSFVEYTEIMHCGII